MDVLFIAPPFELEETSTWANVQGTWPPLGLLSVAAYAESRGHDVGILDALAERPTPDQIGQFIAQHKPRFVALTATTIQIIAAQRIAAIAKESSPDSTVVIGGIHATSLPEEVLQDPNIDVVIRGEGELSFLALIEGEAYEDIPGLSWRSGNPLQPFEHNPTAVPVQDLDTLPLPAYHLIRFDLYRSGTEGVYRRTPGFTMTTSRGCPGKCTFCSSGRTVLRTRSPEHVVNEIQMRQKTYGIREVSFYDDTFTVNKRDVYRMCELIIERKIDLTWSCFARTDCISRKLLERMKAAGCHQILFGIESADAQILENIGKPIDLDQTRWAVRATQEVGITVRAAFMFGNPGETVETMNTTLNFAKSLNPDLAVFNITVPYPGTAMFDWARKNGYLRTCDWRKYDGANALLDLPTVATEKVNAMYRRAFREFYLRPSYVARRLLRIRSLDDIKTGVRGLRAVLGVQTTVGDSGTDWEKRYGAASSPNTTKPRTTPRLVANPSIKKQVTIHETATL